MGIQALKGTGQEPADNDGYLILPADQPGISVEDINRCIGTFSQDSTQIVVASHAGRRGHPIIFPASLVDFVRSEMCDMGLNALPRTHAERVVTIPCRSPGVIKDIDTSDDYESLA